MSLRVSSLCRYLNAKGLGLTWREEDWGAYKWIQALKDKIIRGDCRVPVNGQMLRLSDANRGNAVTWFGILGAQHLTANNINRPVNIVPVPNSASTIAISGPSRTNALAQALASSLANGSVAIDCLRWNADWGSASEGFGSRNREALFSNLTVLESPLLNVVADADFILVDDMTTSGGHLLASATKLKNRGFKVVEAVCGGRTTYDQAQPAFQKHEEDLEGFEP
jgi:predicted amidophosphoribosyltransferase